MLVIFPNWRNFLDHIERCIEIKMEIEKYSTLEELSCYLGSLGTICYLYKDNLIQKYGVDYLSTNSCSMCFYIEKEDIEGEVIYRENIKRYF